MITRRHIGMKLWAGAVFLTVLFGVSSPQEADAQVVFASDCSAGFKNVFFDNEPVCAVVQAAGSVLGSPGVACVVPPGGQPADDVTTGGCNGVGIFLEEPFLWLPPTVPGNYTILVVNNQGGIATDNITILSSGGGAPTVNVAAIKGAAGAAAAHWQTLADWGQYIDEFASAISIAWAVSTGDWVSAAVGAVGLVTGVPTDYNGAVLSQGGEIISALAGVQASRYATLQADPPDPVFNDLVPLDLGAINADLAALAPLNPGVPLQYPFANRTQNPLHLASTALANSMSQESAMVFALMRTLEKFQGAEAAADDELTLVQARALKKYADLLGTQLTTTRQGALDYQTELAAAGLADINYDSADVAALLSRLATTGLMPGEEQSLRDSGFNDPDIQLLFDRVNSIPAPTGTFSRRTALDNIVSAIDGMLPAVQDLGNQAQDVVDHFSPLVTLQHPTADAGGPYNGNEGSAVNLDGSGSTDPQSQILLYEWDLDGDGIFDDAVGQVVSNTYDAPGTALVGLMVTDPDGNSDVDYATVTVAEVNGPPQITSFAPADLAPTASFFSPVDFSATADDPDFDPLSFEWRLNGVVMSTASDWTYAPGIGETGTRTVRLTVSDLNPLSEDAVETRVVLLVDEGLVPNVIGLDQPAAEADIVAAGFTVGAVTPINDAAPPGQVIDQTPAGGDVAPIGSPVDIVVSLGPAPVPVPDVVGFDQATAEALIFGEGFVVGVVDFADSDTVPAGDVISQNPVGGTPAAAGSPVDIVVSLGPALVPVPDVVGLDEATAEALIFGEGFVVGVVDFADSDTVPAGDVISQNPVGGTPAAAGSPVDIVVSLGPALVPVPDVVGLDQATAESAIVAAGLLPAVAAANDPVVPAGDVISQNPPGGTPVALGSAVDIVVSLGPAGQPPDRPENLTARAKELHVNVAWDASAGAASYLVFRRLDTGIGFSMVGSSAFPAFVDDLPAGTLSAEYYVVAENQFGASADSDIVVVTPRFR